MKAMIQERSRSGSDVLRLVDIDPPDVGADDADSVHAAAINPADRLQLTRRPASGATYGDRA